MHSRTYALERFARSRALRTHTLLFLLAATAASQDGALPRSLAASTDGSALLCTSEASDRLSEVRLNPDGTLAGAGHVLVGAPSFGIGRIRDAEDLFDVFLVTHPEESYATRVLWDDAQDSVVSTSQIAVPLGCTEVLPGLEPETFLVANRGAAPAAAQSWQHSVLVVDVDAGTHEVRFVTENEPRALAVALPTGRDALLVVGHAKGNLKLRENGDPNPDHALANLARDGGSITTYDYDDGDALERFAIGSPVRGLAVVPDPLRPDMPAPSALAGGFRLFFTHVGDGAQSEDPRFGGRSIGNVISSLEFDASGAATGIRHTTLAHTPDYVPESFDEAVQLGEELPTVLPEKLAVRWSDAPSWELWVGNSASGTLSRIPLLADASIDVLAGDPLDLRDSAPANSIDDFPVVVDRGSDRTINETQHVINAAGPADALVEVEEIAGAAHVYLGAFTDEQRSFSSNPRGLVYEPVQDRIYAVTRLGHEFHQVDPDSAAVTLDEPIGTNDISDDTLELHRRRFFTFGRAFDFREGGSPKVDNISCGTCHVDGHTDGKVRTTVRSGQNRRVPGELLRKSVAVPSVFDVGSTEWLFFEGLTTIRDNENRFPGCNYCLATEFFQDTNSFTDTFASPESPHASDGVLSLQQERGRVLFEDLNCMRCHSGPIVSSFDRSDEPAVRNDRGPLPGSLVSSNPFLHDPTQSFISQFTTAFSGQSSLRNMTDVGTRNDGRFISGINTPALAGAWDNAPYLHDGRYRTLEEVLDHTWLEAAEGFLSAPLWGGGGPPDNAMNDPSFPFPLLPADARFFDPYPFGTHGHAAPGGGWSSVSSHLDPAELDDLLGFLRGLSSQTDPCAGDLTIGTPARDVVAGDWVFSWTTGVDAACSVTWDDGVGGPQTIPTAVGTAHSITVSPAPGAFSLVIEAERRLCGDSASASFEACHFADVSPLNLAFDPFGCSVSASWTTSEPDTCSVRYRYGTNWISLGSTPLGTSHSVSVPAVANKKFLFEVTGNCSGDVETKKIFVRYCIAGGW